MAVRATHLPGSAILCQCALLSLSCCAGAVRATQLPGTALFCCECRFGLALMLLLLLLLALLLLLLL